MAASRYIYCSFALVNIILISSMFAGVKAEDDKKDPVMARRVLHEVIIYVRSRVLYVGRYDRTVPESMKKGGSYSYHSSTTIRRGGNDANNQQNEHDSEKIKLQDLMDLDADSIKNIVVLERGLGEQVDKDGRPENNQEEFHKELKDLKDSNAAEQLADALQKCQDAEGIPENVQSVADNLKGTLDDNSSGLYKTISGAEPLEVGGGGRSASNLADNILSSMGLGK